MGNRSYYLRGAEKTMRLYYPAGVHHDRCSFGFLFVFLKPTGPWVCVKLYFSLLHNMKPPTSVGGLGLKAALAEYYD